MTQITVQLDLDELLAGYRRVGPDGEESGPVSMTDAIVSDAARQLVERLVRDTDRYGALLAQVNAARDAAIMERLLPLIDVALSRAIQPTNGYGQPVGEPTTLTDVIVQKATKALTEKRSKGYGKPETTLVDEILDESMRRTIGSELREAIQEARAQVHAAVREQGATVIAETIERMAAPR